MPKVRLPCLEVAVLAATFSTAWPADAQGLPDEPPPPSCDLPGAGQPLLPNCVYHVTLPHQGYTRSYKLLVPDGFAATDEVSLIVDYHGYGSSKSNQIAASCWKDLAKREKVLVAYPHGTGFPVSFSAGDYCCTSLVQPRRDDVEFARQVVADVRQRALSPSASLKVYASGLSNGGAVAHNLACEANDLFDGIAPVSQTFAKNTPSGSVCLSPGERHIPIVDFRALSDSLIPYQGGFSWLTLGSWLSAGESLRRWAVEHRCTLDQGAPVIDATWRGSSGQSYCQHYAGCASDLVQCSIDGEHILYSAADSAGLNVCEVAWDVFQSASVQTVR